MAGDPLYEPLGTGTAAIPTSRRPLWIGVAAVVLIGAGVAVWAVQHGSRRVDQAVAVSTIETAPQAPPAAAPAAPAAPSGPPAEVAAAVPQPGGSTVEVQNGVKIIRFNPAASSASVTIPIESAATPLKSAPDPRVSEKTPDGVLPRIGADGSRPAQLYARPAAVTSGPRLAVLLTGMGSDQLATADAARRLPPDLSFAFAPDVSDVPTQVAETRRAGHEVLLDLTATRPPPAVPDPASDGVKALHYAMTRFVGYVGVVVDPGAPDASLALGDIAGRGLFPLVPSAAAAAAAAGVRLADVDVDAGQGPGAVSAALDRLAALARSRGSAVGVVRRAALAQAALSALPDVLATKGITLVPISALADQKASETSLLK